MYSQSYDEYEEHKKEFLEICISVQVFIGTKDKYELLEEQSLKNLGRFFFENLYH